LPQRRAAGDRGFFLLGARLAKDLSLADQVVARELVELMGSAAAREFRDVLKAARDEGRDGSAGVELGLTRGRASAEAAYVSRRFRPRKDAA
jgi:hypothetical protein